MKQSISPAMALGVVVVVLVIVAVVLARVWVAPSSVPAPGTVGAKPHPPDSAIPPEALRARDEWRKTHPESATR